MEKERGNRIFQGDGMTQFTPSDYAKLTAQLDKHNGQNVEYWSKHEIKTN